MIDLTTKIHDKFTLEFKVGFNTDVAAKPMKYSDFVLNTWIFVPNSLDINAAKYSKENFYRDLKSDQRLITPDYAFLTSRSSTTSTTCLSPPTTSSTSFTPSRCIAP